MLSVYETFHQMVKHGRQINQILQDLTGLKIKISMKASETENQFETAFQQPKSGLPKKLVLTSVFGTCGRYNEGMKG